MVEAGIRYPYAVCGAYVTWSAATACRTCSSWRSDARRVALALGPRRRAGGPGSSRRTRPRRSTHPAHPAGITRRTPAQPPHGGHAMGVKPARHSTVPSPRESSETAVNNRQSSGVTASGPRICPSEYPVVRMATPQGIRSWFSRAQRERGNARNVAPNNAADNRAGLRPPHGAGSATLAA